MSPLTKVFVVLLVIVSLLQTAGMVVFVNKIRPMQNLLDQSNLDLATLKAQTDAANSAAKSQQAQNAQLVTESNSSKQASAAVIGRLQSDNATLTTQIAQLTAEKTNLSTSLERQTEQMNWMTSTNAELTKEVKNLRDTNDVHVKRDEENSRQIASLTNLSDTLKAQYDNTREQLQLVQDTNDKYKTAILNLGGDPSKILGAGIVQNGPGTPLISGHVQETKVSNGAKYVTINVGSADGVIKGMRFAVLDPQGNFLCFAYVETVDNNDAIGKLDGQQDKISQVQVSDDVKTQIRGS